MIEAIFHVAMKVFGWVFICGFAGMWISHSALADYDKALVAEYQKPPKGEAWWPLQNYPPEAHRMWKLRQWPLRILIGSFAALLLACIIAGFAGVQLVTPESADPG